MANLQTTYLGFDLPHPLVPGASPLADTLDGVRRLQDAGAPMITLRSLIAAPLQAAREAQRLDQHGPQCPPRSVMAGLQEPPVIATQPHRYCSHIGRIRRAVGDRYPIVGSVYARRMDDWLANCRLLELAGADAVELNIYGMALTQDAAGHPAEEQIVDVVRNVSRQVRIPVVVKLLPFYRTFDAFVRKLPDAGADGLVMFNGFCQADLGIDPLDDPFLQAISSPVDPHYRFRWIARLSGRIGSDLAFSGGARHALHAVKAIQCGAAVVQVVSALIQRGPEYLATLVEGMHSWLDQQGFESIDEIAGRASIRRYDSLEAFEMAFSRLILMRTQSSGMARTPKFV